MSVVPVVITGLGPVSAVGCGRERFWEALVDGRSGFAPITLCDVSRSASKIGAEVKDFRLGRYVSHGRSLERRLARSVQLALAATALALDDAGLDPDGCDPHRIGVHVGTSVANLAEELEVGDGWRRSGKPMTVNAAFNLFNHSAACVLSAHFDLRGPIFTTTSGCNSGLDALGQSYRLIQLGQADAMLVVGTDCELIPELLAAMNASGSLTTSFNDQPSRASRPYDRDRDGNVIGEGAAALLLESAAHAQRRAARPYARIVGHAVCAAGRKHRYGAEDPEPDLRPCLRAFRGAVEEAGWSVDQVDLVNGNGSSSVVYDRLEAKAMGELFGDRFCEVPVHSIKSMLGQHGAGSSALQVAAACLTIAGGTVPPTINHDNPDPACGPIRVVTEVESLDPGAVLVHSIGLGGFYYSCGAFAAA